jgi:uncharacterized SAM-binding protein YcdF (DUF218 family)
VEIDVATRGLLKLALLPPGILIILLVVAWLLGGRALGRLLSLAAIALFYFLSTPAGLDWLAQRVETIPAQSTAQLQQSGAGAIWVLMGGIESNNPELAGAARLGTFSMARVDYALHLHRETGLPIALSGGTPLGDRPASAEVAAGWLRQQAQVEPLLVEANSLDTWENARESAARLTDLGVERVLLVTHAFHMPRAMISAKAAGIDAVPAPCCFEHTPPALKKPGLLTDWLPTPGVLGKNYLMLHEMVGLVWYGVFRDQG